MHTTCLAGLFIRMCIPLFLAWHGAFAQVRPSRTWESAPSLHNVAQGVMPTLLGGGEFQRSWGSAFGEQAWQFRTHVQVEPYRFTDSAEATQWTTTIEAHQELTANPLNDISFNPRTMRWEEFFWLHMITKSYAARIGFVHRCKHDIDNLAGPDEYNPISPLQAEQRTIILTGPAAAVSLPSVESVVGSVSVSAGAEWFLNASDNRRPSSSMGSWSGMQGAAWMRVQNILELAPTVGVLISGIASAPWYSSRPGASSDVPYDARAELALSLMGPTSRLDIALVAERSFDELAMAMPARSSYVGLCVRFMPKRSATE
ncbi:MAG: hypothetical protein FGM32_10380 [Candidatus Kapabacteria bacterium]|nr:hypothetical protein [Candidatus Kapabacteria bacterium]